MIALHICNKEVYLRLLGNQLHYFTDLMVVVHILTLTPINTFNRDREGAHQR